MSRQFRRSKDEDERSPERKGDFAAQADEIGEDPSQIGERAAGHGGESQGLSAIVDANDESVEELANEDQAVEAAAIEGVEDAADHPERPVHTHVEYGVLEDAPPAKNDDEEAA
jgi:hypothetical protein